jgi:hypothetical protein
VLVGTALENAAQEMENVGGDDRPSWERKYRLVDLLDPDFRLPAGEEDEMDFKALRGEGFIYDEVGP